MSMSDGLTRSNADAVLKEFYLPGIRSILNNEVFLLTQMEQNSEDIEGRRAVLAINTGRNEGVGARAEMGDLPDPGHQQYAEERVPLKYNYGRIQLSGPVIRSMGSDRGSFTRALQSETTGVVRDLRNDVNRQIYGDGTGAFGPGQALAGNASSTTVDMTGFTASQMRQFNVGMLIDIGTPANPVLDAEKRRVVAVDRVTPTITLDAAVTVTAASNIFRHASGGTGATQVEITGLNAQIKSDGVLWNIDAAQWPNWASYVNPAAGAVSEDMFIQASQEVNLDSGEQLDLWVTTPEIHRAVAGLLTSLKRFPTTNEMRGGYSALDVTDMSQGGTGPNTVSMFYDKDMTEDGAAYGLTTRRWQCYKMSDWEFMQEDGAVLHRTPGKDAYNATLFVYHEIATDGRNAHAKLEGIDTA